MIGLDGVVGPGPGHGQFLALGNDDAVLQHAVVIERERPVVVRRDVLEADLRGAPALGRGEFCRVGLVRGVERGAEGYRGVGVAELRFLAEDAADGRLDAGYAAGAAGEEDAGEFAAVEAGPQQHAFAGHLGLGDEAGDGGFEFGPRDFDVHATVLSGTEWEADGLPGR